MRHVVSDPDGRQPNWECLERLIRDALQACRSASTDETLIAQIDSATIESIDFTGHGFYADLSLPPKIPSLAKAPDFPVYRAFAEAGDERISLLLWVEKLERIVCVEGYNAGDVQFSANADYQVSAEDAAQP